MRRRDIVVAAGALLVAPLVRAAAQERRPRIIVLHSGFANRVPLHLLVEQLGRLGYEDGRSARIEIHGAEGDLARLAALVGRIVADPPDVTVSITPPAAGALKAAGLASPVVFMVVNDPVRLRLIQSLTRPGGNFTGVASPDAVVAGKRVELLIDALPGLRRVAILWSATFFGGEALLEAGREAAVARGLDVVVREYAGPDDLPAAFAAVKAAGAEGLVFQPDNATFGRRKEVAALALGHRLPSVHSFSPEVEDGALMAYGNDLADDYRRVAVLVDRILKGARPADLPVEEPTRFTLAVNLKTAAALGIVLPPAILARADEVIE
jgi:putative ABC transport system substrate-binding protein